MEYDQCTPLITSDHGIDARGEVAKGRVWAATCPKSCRCNSGSHINRPRLGVVIGIDSSNITPRLKIIGNSSHIHRAMIRCIRVEKLKRSDGDNTFLVVISLQDGRPKRITEPTTRG